MRVAVATANLAPSGCPARSVSPTRRGRHHPLRRGLRRPGPAYRPRPHLLPRHWTPPWSFVESLLAGNACVKTAPGIPHEVIPAGVEAEWVSDHGEVKEAALWGGRLATVARRATVIGDGGLATSPTRTTPARTSSRSAGSSTSPTARSSAPAWSPRSPPASQGGLLDQHIAYITADSSFHTPFARSYEVLETLPHREKAAARRAARARHRPADHQEARRRRRPGPAAQAARADRRQRGHDRADPGGRAGHLPAGPAVLASVLSPHFTEIRCIRPDSPVVRRPDATCLP